MAGQPIPAAIKVVDNSTLIDLQREAVQRGGRATDPDWLAARIAPAGRHLLSAVKASGPDQLACLAFIEMADGVDLLGNLDVPLERFTRLAEADRPAGPGAPAARVSRRGWLRESEWISRFGE